MKSSKKQCYALWQAIVCERDKACVRCGNVPISGHHVFGRNKMGSAFDPDSGLGICPECHDGWARLRPGEAKELLIRKIGIERYEDLLRRSNQVYRMREYDFMRIAIELGVKLVEIREGNDEN